ncbi:hypothetical protein DFH07DRAFT_949615 [Mycena maculata]|uniref:Uncharacterized protein n=1 Tax=Mycena maculata TaxID=230809 RepID=A0AAD7KF83_9AGAR|nr:hypothetical protein DFH07DRAFT_949615 [Mycena maculata]
MTEPSAEAHIARTATYASAATSTSPLPIPNTAKHTLVATPSRATSPVPIHTVTPCTGANNQVRSWASLLIIRFDPTDPIPPKRADTPELYAAIMNVLPKHAYHLAGVSWTRKGNLVLHACSGPRLGFSTKKTLPKFEIDEPWYSVIVHRAPMPPNRSPDAITLASVQYWFADDFETCDSLSIRISLSSEADTLHLVKNGGTFFGAMCRVSRYVPKSPLHSLP